MAKTVRNSGYESVSVRKIDNGFLVCRSSDKGYSEVYTPRKPKLDMPDVAKAKSVGKPNASAGMGAVKKAAGKKR